VIEVGKHGLGQHGGAPLKIGGTSMAFAHRWRKKRRRYQVRPGGPAHAWLSADSVFLWPHLA
jgi:hypothetical protein